MGKGEVLDPITVGIAVLAWLVIYGAQLLAQAMGGILESIPLIGSAISRFTFYIFPEWQNFWSQTPPVSQAVTAVNVNHATEQGLNVEAHKANLGAIQGIYNSALPQTKQQAIATAGAIQAPVNAQLQQTVSTLSGVDSWAQQQIHALQQATTVTLPQQINGVARTLTGELQQTAGALESSIIRTTQALGQQIAAVQQTAATNLQRTTDALRGDIGQAATAAEAGAIRAVQPQIGAVQTDLGAIAQQITGVITPSLVQQAAITTALSQVLTQVEQCTLGICETGSGPTLGNLGKDLQGVASLFDAALLFAMVTEAITNPKASADAIVAVAGPVAAAGVAFVRGAVGLAEAA